MPPHGGPCCTGTPSTRAQQAEPTMTSSPDPSAAALQPLRKVRGTDIQEEGDGARDSVEAALGLHWRTAAPSGCQTPQPCAGRRPLSHKMAAALGPASPPRPGARAPGRGFAPPRLASPHRGAARARPCLRCLGADQKPLCSWCCPRLPSGHCPLRLASHWGAARCIPGARRRGSAGQP